MRQFVEWEHQCLFEPSLSQQLEIFAQLEHDNLNRKSEQSQVIVAPKCVLV